MQDRRSTLLGTGGSLCLLALAAASARAEVAGDGTDGRWQDTQAAQGLRAFLRERPGTTFARSGERVTRIYGRAFAHGLSARQSAERFRLEHAAILGVSPQNLVPGGASAALPHEQPLMYEAARGAFKFTMITYRQEQSGVPVFRSQIKLLVANQPDHPLVLASADLRPLGAFQVDPALAGALDFVQLDAVAAAEIDPAARAVDGRLVVWAGVGDEPALPRPAYETIVAVGPDKWLLVVDAETGGVLYREHVICTVDIVGTADGLSTQGVGAEQCELEVASPLPYMLVTAGLSSAFTAADGSFSIPSGASPINVIASLNGAWFDVANAPGAEVSLTIPVTPPGPATFLFNAANTDSLVRAQVNGYVHSNIVRDFVLAFNPAYPTLDEGDFPVTVNRTDFVCPGNAWYDPDEVSINFCQAGGGHPNTAWSSVIYHEYGHHLVAAAGSGQGQYGEGMGDVMSVLILDSPLLGFGFFNDCVQSLRTADNTIQYPCSGEAHTCGQLISGCVWDTRNELFVSEPDDYQAILSNLVVNSILVHSGSNISPQITIDLLTLDDDNGNIFDGTPHYPEIDAGFGAHNMPGPELQAISFEFPDGLPGLVSPFGGASIRVEVIPVLSSPQPGTGVLHLSAAGAGGGFVEIPMVEVEPNVYDAIFPELDCGSPLTYYFSAQSTGGAIETWPADAPVGTLSAVAATDVTVTFADDFEQNLGWTVTNSPSLTDGQWTRGVPVGGGDRGDPPFDADGSGQCFLTDNVDGNSDVDSGSTTVTSPSLDASGDDTFVGYYRWYDNTFGDSPFQDTMLVEVSANGGGSWVNLETIGPGGPQVQGGWYFKLFKVADFVTPSSAFRIRFVAQDTDPQSVVEAGVDGVRLESYTCVPPDDCPADTNDDGNVDVQDLVNVIVAWGTDDPAADVDGSGTVDVQDLVGVITAWGACGG